MKKGIWLAVLGVLGFIGSFSLVLERIAVYADPRHVAVCDINPLFSCTSITQTWQASLFGFPNPLIGVAVFPIAIAYGVLIASNVRLPRWIHLSFLVGITLGLVFIGWLFSQAVYVIGLLCLYCMLVWIVVITLFFLSLHTCLTQGHVKIGSPSQRVGFAGWLWVIEVGLILTLACCIFLSLFL